MYPPAKPGDTVDEDAATLQLIQIVLPFLIGKSHFLPITYKAKKRLQKLLGLKTLHTKDKHIYWQIPPDLPVKLQAIGLDPTTHSLINPHLFHAALLAYDQAHLAKFQDDCARQDFDARRNALANAMQATRPTKPPKAAPPADFLKAHLLNTKIAQHLARERDA